MRRDAPAEPASERRAAALFSRRATRRDEGAPRSEEGKAARIAALREPASTALLRHTRPMMIGVGLDARLGLPLPQLREAAIEAGRLGFESVWTPAGGVPDSFHVCAAWSHDTSLRTGISVVPAARMWTPLSLAAQAATLAQLSSGQFVLGLGTGGY